MNKVFFSSLFLLFSMPIICQDVSIENIRNKAISFMNSKTGRSNSIKSIESVTDNNIPVLNLIHFNSGGWILMSCDYRTKPVLGYGLNGLQELKDIPPGLQTLVNDYKKQILEVKKNKTLQIKVNDEWYNKGDETKSILTTDIFGLLKTSRGLVLWNQEKNNSGGCTPSYNQACPWDWIPFPNCLPGGTCNCGRKPVGCGAVAMGQIMWYWQYPHSYNWDIIPTALYDNTPVEQAAELARLLSDVRIASQMNYCCRGSWATTENIEDALVNNGFLGASKKVRSAWPNNEAWQDLMRAELDAGRPILYRGGEIIDPGDWGNVHFFVCDGYDRNSPSYFHFNWGWGNYSLSDPDNSQSCFTVDNLNPSGNNYSNFQQMIIGISPDCSDLQESITSLPYTSINSEVTLLANTISIPSTGSILEIESGGSLLMSATNSISINAGFYANAGSSVFANVGPYNCDCDISVLGWTSYFACDGMSRV